MPKKLKGGTFWSRPVLRAKKEKPFELSSLGQMVEFDILKFGIPNFRMSNSTIWPRELNQKGFSYRTYENYFGQFVWI